MTLVVGMMWSGASLAQAPPNAPIASGASEGYQIGVNDTLDIAILQPEQLQTFVTVGPDGMISFPFIGNVRVKGMTTAEIQEDIQQRLADGYMKYPVVSVSLKESRSQKFFVYGEVAKPGAYPLDERVTAMKAISIAEGFTKFGDSSRVKVLRPYADSPGYETIPINLKAVLNGNSKADVLLRPGDTVVVSEGVF
ncbi:MAG: polysaccharide export protein [Candidatus Omnitrophica bacterium]|nr:polysaccharide export protein [Candidatus Omnitrophota bacterium]